MISKFTKIILPVLLLLMFGEASLAQSGKENPITTAVPFLRLAADARTGGMGDVGVATSPDVNSMFYNGSKTVFNDAKYGVGLNYTPWLSELDVKNLYQISLSGFYKLNEKEAISFGFRNFSLGTFTLTDNIGQEVSTYKPQDLALEAGYSRKLSDKLGVGLSLRYINSKLANSSVNSNYKSGSAVAADLSAFYMNKKGWNFGAALTNLGSKINYGGTDSYIPANLALGAAYNKKIDDDNKISFALDLNKLMVPTPPDPSDPAKVMAYENKGVVGSWFSSFGDAPGGFSEEIKEFQLGLGTEYTYHDQFSVRAGYFTENKLKGNRNYFTVGAGVMYKVAGLNFSYLVPTGNNTNNNALKNTIRLSLLFDFNAPSTK
ncbi:type IX secretion system outer membrane channel protein PorV [Ferruginibacter profundus]